jgi:CDP-diacylglycerol--glycerol-3-phosphate 3-phosphatidyltransferase
MDYVNNRRKKRFAQGGFQGKKTGMANLANILTLGRLILLPLIIVLFFFTAPWALWASLALYIVASVTDWLDGWVARRYDQVSDFGKFMDPIADKIFVVTILLMLIAVDRVNGLWVIPVIVILVREFMVSGMREFLGPRNIQLPVSRLAKWKTATQMMATGLLIMGPLSFYIHAAGLAFLLAAMVITVVTGWDYLRTGFRHMF